MPRLLIAQYIVLVTNFIDQFYHPLVTRSLAHQRLCEVWKPYWDSLRRISPSRVELHDSTGRIYQLAINRAYAALSGPFFLPERQSPTLSPHPLRASPDALSYL